MFDLAEAEGEPSSYAGGRLRTRTSPAYRGSGGFSSGDAPPSEEHYDEFIGIRTGWM